MEHIVRKQKSLPSFKLGVRSLAVLVSFIFVILLFSLIGKFTPVQTLSYMFGGVFDSSKNISNGVITNFNQTVLNIVMILVLAIGLAPAFRMKYWNTGALGQALIGNLCASLIVFYLGALIGNKTIVMLLAFVAAVIGGAIWGGIPGFFKAKLNANETLFTLMMNYIAIQLVQIFIAIFKGKESFLSPFDSRYCGFDKILGLDCGWAVLIAVIVCVLVYIYMKFTKQGYEIAVLGESQQTAKYAGIDTTKVTIRTAVISGVICAICGFIYTGNSNMLSITSDGGYGFTSIIVTWTSHFSVFAMVVVSTLIAIYKTGSDGIKNKASDRMNDYASYIAMGILLFFLIGCEFFLNFEFRKGSKAEKVQQQVEDVADRIDPVRRQRRIMFESSFIGEVVKDVKKWWKDMKDPYYRKGYLLSFFFAPVVSIICWCTPCSKGVKRGSKDGFILAVVLQLVLIALFIIIAGLMLVNVKI